MDGQSMRVHTRASGAGCSPSCRNSQECNGSRSGDKASSTRAVLRPGEPEQAALRRRAAPWRSRRARARAAGAGPRPGRKQRAPPSAAMPGFAPHLPPPASRSQPQPRPSQPLASWSCWWACDGIQERRKLLLCLLAGCLARRDPARAATSGSAPHPQPRASRIAQSDKPRHFAPPSGQS